MDQTSGTTPTGAPTEGQQESAPAQTPAAEQPGFGSRGRIRRRARFLRRARELAYRDLGGLVYNLHRFGQRNDSLVLAKLATLAHIDTELRTIEAAAGDQRPITVLREAGITACPRCAAIHGSEDRFCPNCGLPLSGHADLPIAGAPAAVVVATPPPQPPPVVPSPPPPAADGVPAGAPATTAVNATSEPARGEGRAPTPPVRAPAPAATPPATRPSGSEDSTEILRPSTPSQ